MTSEQHPPDSTPEHPGASSAGPSENRTAPGGPTDRASTSQSPTAPPSVPASADPAPSGREEPAYREVTIRRAPKFIPFMLLGALVGFIAALVIAYGGEPDPSFTRESVLGFFFVVLALPGLLIAALLVLVFDRRSVKRSERARAQRTWDDED